MARLTRKFLKALGVEEESKQDEIIDAHTETVDALKNERDLYKANAERYKADSDKLPDIQKELDNLKKEKESYGSYEDKYKGLKQEFDDYKAGVEAEKVKSKKTAAYKKLLKEAGVSEKRIDSILKVSNDIVNSVEFDDKDGVKNAEDLTEKVKQEWSDFIETSETRGASVSPKLPNGNGAVGVGSLSRAAQLATKHYENLYGSNGGKDL